MGSRLPDHAQPSGRYRWHHWNDGSVGYDRSEGASIALSPLSVELLRWLEQDPSLTEEALVARASGSPLVATPAAVHEALRALKSNGLA